MSYCARQMLFHHDVILLPLRWVVVAKRSCSADLADERLLPEVFPRHYSHAFFSALVPGSHISPHCGPSNKMLRCHLPLLGLEGARLHVGDEVRRRSAARGLSPALQPRLLAGGEAKLAVKISVSWSDISVRFRTPRPCDAAWPSN